MLETIQTVQSDSPKSISLNEITPKKFIEKSNHKSSTSSSSLDNSFENYNIEIKSIIENEFDISFSNESDSETDELDKNLDYFLTSKFWKVNNNNNLSNHKQNSFSNDNENKEIKYEHFQNGSSSQSSNNSPIHNKSDNNGENINGNNLININIQKEYSQKYEANMNYSNNNNKPFFQGLYLNPQLYNPYINNMNNFNNQINQNQINMKDFPLIMNNNQNNNLINYNYQNFNYNMIPYPHIQPSLNNSIQKYSSDKIINNSNNLPDKCNQQTSQAKNQEPKTVIQNNNNNNNSNINSENDNKNNSIKINNKNFIMNKPKTNTKGNQKGEKQLLNLDDIVTGKDTNTTVMIRNIPIKYTDKILNEDLKEFKGKYDCLYMPYDYEKNGNKGYAFINFVNPLHILYFYETFNGRKWDQFESNKICELNSAHFQGINEIQKHAKNYKGQKKPNYFNNKNELNENMIIPNKYLLKLRKRFPKMKYTENKVKKIINVKSFE